MNANEINWRELLEQSKNDFYQPPQVFIGTHGCKGKYGKDNDPHFYDLVHLNYCGAVASGSKDGKLHAKRISCNYWRNCATCLRMRANNHKLYVNETVTVYGGFKVVEFPPNHDKMLREMCTRLGKDNYLKMPQEDGSTIMIVGGNEPLSQVEKDCKKSETVYSKASDLPYEQWLKIVKTPWHKSITGKLGRIPEKKAPDNVEIVPVTTTRVIANADYGTCVLAWEAAVKQTNEMPKDSDDYKRLTKLRNDAYYNELLLRAKRVKNITGNDLIINKINLNERLEIIRYIDAENGTITYNFYTLPVDKPVHVEDFVERISDYQYLVEESNRLLNHRAKNLAL